MKKVQILTVLLPLITVVNSVRYALADQCDKSVDVKQGRYKDRTWDITLPLEGSEQKCIFSLFGTEDCDVEVSCTIDIPLSDACELEDDYLKITDGVDGEIKMCGKDSVKYSASKGLRDLFLVLVTDEQTGHIKCEAKCIPTGSGEHRLPKNIKLKTDTRCACGLQNKDDRIVGGEDAKHNEFPWLGPIVFPNTRTPFCAGAVINDRFVLTAAHCYAPDGKRPEDIEFLLKAHTLDMFTMLGANEKQLGEDGSIRSSGWNLQAKTDADEGTQRYKIEEIINHPLFTEQYDYDFTLLKLAKKLDFSASDAITPVCLPPANTFDSLMSKWKGKSFTVAGWGLAGENAGGSTRVLQKLDVPFVDWPSCEMKISADVLTRRMLCAGYEEGVKDACMGDSGGPLVWKAPTKQWWQVGVVSWGEGCARKGKPGLYSRVTEMMQWINFHTSEREAKWCEKARPL